MSDRGVVDPVAKLLKRDETREDMLRALGLAQRTLAEAVNEFRDAWKAATGTGWASKDLLGAGFTDPKRLPRFPVASSKPGGSAVETGSSSVSSVTE